MSVEANKAVIRRWIEEAWNQGRVSLADELFAPDFTAADLDAPGQLLRGPAGMRESVISIRSAFPDLQITVDQLVAEGDLVVGAFTARATHRGEYARIPPTGRPVRFSAVEIWQLRNGKIAQRLFAVSDKLSLLEQIGGDPRRGVSTTPLVREQASGRPVADVIRQRFSCRSYSSQAIEDEKRRRLQDAMDSFRSGPLGTPVRFQLVGATERDRSTLKGLGTYGLIRGASGFIVGAAKPGRRDLEDYGYVMERLVLLATELGLGTCWLGGTFAKSAFVTKIQATGEEQVPAVVSIGYMENAERARNALTRRLTGADSRLPWERLFFQGGLRVPLTREQAGPYAAPLDLVQLAPSASNRQPWRIVKDRTSWHFYLQRTKGYRAGLASRLMRVADIQRVDLGIAMCHFELSATDLCLTGKWAVQDPGLKLLNPLSEYVVTWIE